MDCSKGTAIRVREAAENKIQRNDFQGAWISALAAKSIFPQLENISQLLPVCDVHCSALKKICGTEKDWYEILQVERAADEATIKKQYRKLALLLHPDKNKFPGAEAAFKLIGEAHTVLSDEKSRLAYDSKHRASVTAVRKKERQQANRKPVVRKSHDAQNINPNISTQQSGAKHRQPKIPDLFRHVAAFWAQCTSCKCQFFGGSVKNVNYCRNCSIAQNLGSAGVNPVTTNKANSGPQGVVPGSSNGEAAVSQQKPFSASAFKVGAESNKKCTSSCFGSKVNSGGDVGFEQMKPTEVSADVEGNLRSKSKDVNEGVGVSKAYPPKTMNSGTFRNKERKKGRKSSESCDMMSSSDCEEVVLEESKGVPAGNQTPGQDSVYSCRTSSRKKQKISYNENADDADFMNTHKRPTEKKLKGGKGEQKESSREEFKVGIRAKESLLHGNDEAPNIRSM